MHEIFSAAPATAGGGIISKYKIRLTRITDSSMMKSEGDGCLWTGEFAEFCRNLTEKHGCGRNGRDVK